MYIETDTGIMVKLENVKSSVMYDEKLESYRYKK